MEGRLGITLLPEYCYKLGPLPKTREYDSIVGPFNQEEAIFILYFNRKKEGEFNEIATSLLKSKEKVHGEAFILRSRGLCKDTDLLLFGKILKKYLK